MRRGVAVWLTVAALLLTGCWDMKEIEDTIYVGSVGIDPLEENQYLWTFRLVEPEKLVLGMLTAVQGEAGRLASGMITVRANSLEQAVQMIQPGLSRIVSLEHIRWISIHEDLARKGVSPLISQLLRNGQVRRGASLYVFAGPQSIAAFLNQRPVADTNPLKYFEGLRLVQKRMHLSPPLQLQHFYSRLMSPGLDPMLPLASSNARAQGPPGPEVGPEKESYKSGETPRKGGNPNEFLGTGIFRGDRLVGTLTVDETAAVLAMRGEMGKVYASVPDPINEGLFILLRIHQENKPQFRASFAGGRPTVHVKLQFEGEILSAPGRTDYSRPENRRILERQMAKFLKESAFIPVLEKLHTRWGADPVGFGQLFRGRFPTHDAWVRYKWEDHVKDLAVTPEIDIFIRRFGMLLGNPEVQ
ncbi:MAG TPA: Ger(x)C family spore germination protein [Symbiobacteriaceae bacterium]|nr:Ger(x)C family spore germination protein [Symbiobacteriaceae bacterium]